MAGFNPAFRARPKDADPITHKLPHHSSLEGRRPRRPNNTISLSARTVLPTVVAGFNPAFPCPLKEADSTAYLWSHQSSLEGPRPRRPNNTISLSARTVLPTVVAGFNPAFPCPLKEADSTAYLWSHQSSLEGPRPRKPSNTTSLSARTVLPTVVAGFNPAFPSRLQEADPTTYLWPHHSSLEGRCLRKPSNTISLSAHPVLPTVAAGFKPAFRSRLKEADPTMYQWPHQSSFV